MSDVECASVTPETFESCPNPRLLPTLATDVTQYQIAATNELHKKKINLSKEQRFVERSLKSKVINDFDETYLMCIKEDYIVHNNVSAPDMLDHLHKHQGKVNDADFLANKETKGKHWNPDTPIQTIYKQVEDGVKITVLVGLTTDDKEKIAMSHQLNYQTCETLVARRDQRKLPEGHVSWVTFKPHFTPKY